MPDENQCAGCHALEHHVQRIEPIGVRARHLNKDYRYAHESENQLAHWQKLGVLTGAPEESILLHRMASVEADVAMPELGRALVHTEGLALIRDWIASLSGSCVARP